MIVNNVIARSEIVNCHFKEIQTAITYLDLGTRICDFIRDFVLFMRAFLLGCTMMRRINYIFNNFWQLKLFVWDYLLMGESNQKRLLTL